MEIIIDGIPGVSGTYEFNVDSFTNAELRLIKREANVRAGEIEEALQAGDNDVLVCFALIALKRAARDIPPELLWEAEVGSITLDVSDEEEDAGPPEVTPVSNESRNGHIESSSLSSSDDGEASPEPTILSPTGSLG